jgi:hypothetical protein
MSFDTTPFDKTSTPLDTPMSITRLSVELATLDPSMQPMWSTLFTDVKAYLLCIPHVKHEERPLPLLPILIDATIQDAIDTVMRKTTGPRAMAESITYSKQKEEVFTAFRKAFTCPAL